MFSHHLYIGTHYRSSLIVAGELEFTEQELAFFEMWLQEGSDVTDNYHYSAWLAHFHPTAMAASHVWMQGMQSTGISWLLPYPTPPARLTINRQKSDGRVVTNYENLVLLHGGKAKSQRVENYPF